MSEEEQEEWVRFQVVNATDRMVVIHVTYSLSISKHKHVKLHRGMESLKYELLVLT